MTLRKFTPQPSHVPGHISSGDLIADFRARLALVQAESIERRRKELAEQVSVLNTPDARIRIWERLHELALPRTRTHPLMRIIAAHTGLTIEQVHEEQTRRSSSAAPPSHTAQPTTR
jgi:hypothetical protein